MTREERIRKWERRRRAKRIACMKRLALIMFAVVLVITGIIFFKSESKASEEATTRKLYKTVHVQAGETLWSIAEENLYGYDSINDYVKEVAFINHLKDTNRIRTGEVLVLPYYVDIEEGNDFTLN